MCAQPNVTFCILVEIDDITHWYLDKISSFILIEFVIGLAHPLIILT